MSKPLTVSTPSDREIQIVRSFDAPREMVFDCWTKPELVRRWLMGPEGWTFSKCEIDLRVGGKYRYEWRNADGRSMAMTGVFREVAPPERLIDAQVFDDDWTNGEAIGTVVFEARGDKTIVTTTVLYASKAARDGALQSGMERGMEAGYARLDALFAA